jgi:uncharacterized repeat protein (TIGR04076 family)
MHRDEEFELDMDKRCEYGDDWRDFCKYNTPRRVKLTVVKVTDHPQAGVCHCHKVGDTFSCDFERVPGDICAAAWNALWPHLRTVELGGRHPWDEQAGVTYAGCPDPFKPVVFKIETYED